MELVMILAPLMTMFALLGAGALIIHLVAKRRRRRAWHADMRRRESPAARARRHARQRAMQPAVIHKDTPRWKAAR